jgi:hypothetical protein
MLRKSPAFAGTQNFKNFSYKAVVGKLKIKTKI